MVDANFIFCGAAHTISQRIRQLKKVPPELIPLGMIKSILRSFCPPQKLTISGYVSRYRYRVRSPRC